MRKTFLQHVIFLLFTLSIVPMYAQTLDTLASKHERKLEHTLEAIRQQREAIAQERLPMARILHEREEEARSLRKEAATIQRRRDSMSVDIDTLRSRVQAEQKEIGYITRSLIPDYMASWDAALSPGKRASTGERLQEYYLSQDKISVSATERLQHSIEMLNDSLRAIEESIGGQRYAGEVLNDEGRVQQAQFTQLGPLLYAYIPEEDEAGILQRSDSTVPRLITLESRADAIQSLAQDGSGAVPVDPTLGNAQALAQTRDSLLEHLEKGGIWVYPILLFALAATLVAVLKSIQIFRIRNADISAIHMLVLKIRKGDKDEALALAHQQPQPSRAMFEAAAENTGESVELVEEVMYEQILATQPRLERYLNVIAVTAATAPLLGLLGTVTGIIKTFELMSVYGAGDPKPLISGISEALITTELGLVLAIPALVLHALLSRRAAGILSRLEQMAMALVNGISRREAKPASAEA